MSRRIKKQQVLEILAENLNNPQPQVVHSGLIADRLKISVEETCHLLKIMDENGVVVSDIEGQHALITKEGLNSIALNG